MGVICVTTYRGHDPNGHKVMKNLTATITFISLLAGALLTIWGLAHMQWPQALPWSDKDALFRFASFLIICTILVSIGSWWSKRNALLVGVAVAVSFALLAGALWPLLVTLWFAIASALTGRSTLSILRIKPEADNWLTNFLVGAGVYGTAVGLLAHFPVNYPGVYGAALALPLILGWRVVVDQTKNILALMAQKSIAGFSINGLDVAIAVVALVYFVVALMPEVGHDALAMHLFIPSHLALRHQWGFDADTYVWAVMPMLGDWIFTIGYVLAGETASRLINISFILVLGWLVRDLVFWAGGTVYGARWAALIFLSTPLTFTESSTLFIESIWAVFFVAGTLALLRLCESSDKTKSWIVLAALFLAFAVTTKAVTLTLFPVLLLLVLWHYKSCLKAISIPSLVAATSLFLIIGIIPYLTAWWLTGNPVFPFFNGVFKSPYYSPVNFDSATTFGKGLTWDVLYRATFDSGKYLEASAGASGFQWLILFVPTSIILFVGKQRKGITLLLIGVSVVVAVFQSVSYLRYAFPAWAILSAAMGLALGGVKAESKAAKPVLATAFAATVLLNLLFLGAGAPYKDFPLKSIWDMANRDAYLQGRLPIRKTVELLNQLNVGRSPVAVFGQPLTAGIKSDALYSNWYNFRFQGEINAANTTGDVANVLLQRGVEFVILDSHWSGGPEKRELIGKATELVVEYGSIGVRRVRSDFRFKTELLKNPSFSSIDGWSLTPGAEYDAASNVITANVTTPASQAIVVAPGQRFLNTVVARCVKEAALGRVQINWLDAKGQFITTDIKTFDCTPDWAEQAMEVAAPTSATVAIVYVTGHTATPLQFKSNSLRK
jgi:4-amino-4-deoxy-L-arabinose transferase-like glycosyltransferase